MPVHPDLIVWGASVRTLDPELPRCSALAVKNGVILAWYCPKGQAPT